MYVPTTPALAAQPLAPAGIVASEGAAPPAPVETALPGSVETILSVRRAVLNVLDGQAASVAGTLLADSPASAGRRVGLAGRIVSLQRHGLWGWRTIAGTHTGPGGRYRLRYRPRHVGSERLRVAFAGAAGDHGARRAVGRLNVYRLAEASWYGGGGSLACGGWLTGSTLGVASKTLPCGTRVTLRYRGRTVRVRVIDRGPYVAGREFDLTEATKRALSFEGVGVVWVAD
ncbi:MAG TPA: septal ring lytic transglycosylase RlpA family protein [Solirubrobacteraceae bacterium]|jgi:rare lipoprotein A|nr:septal ring lytic transglycosylase RlpA family protein [Solirubrobacteraceae bacterium]